MIKNAIIYTAKLPMISHDTLVLSVCSDEYMSKLRQITAKKPTALQLSTIGLSVNPITKDMISTFQGGYCLQFTKWEKKINVKALNAKVQDHIDTVEANEGGGFTYTKKQRDDVKDQIITELLPTLLPVPKIITCYYLEESEQLIFDSTSTNDCEEVISLLRKTLGSLPAELQVLCDSDKLEDRLIETLEEPGDLSNSFSLGESVELKGKGKIKYDDVNLFESSTVTEITESLSSGMSLITLQLKHFTHEAKFNLVDCYKLKKLVFSGFESGDSEDPVEDWQAEAFYTTTVLNTIIVALKNELN